MFSSTHFPSTTHLYPPTDYSLHYEKDGFHFNHNNHFVNGGLGSLPAVTDYVMAGQHEQLSRAPGLHNGDESKKIPNMKKDSHSKIYTAQGPRDRRVRLSMAIAKKFFHLQDLLEFDKASKTLDWLFTKSKTAIKELVQELKHGSFSCGRATGHCEVLFQESNRGGLHGEENKKCFEGKKKKMARKYKSGADVNQSRAEARARARERTKHKLLNKKLDYNSKKVPDDCYRPTIPSNITHTSSFWSQIEPQSECNYNRAGKSVMEPNVSMLHGYQHNLNVYGDLSSQIKYTNFLNLQ